MRSALLAALAVLALTTACGSDAGRTTDPGAAGAPGPVGSVTVVSDDAAPMSSAGDTRILNVVVKNLAGVAITNPDVVWTSDAPAVATVAVFGANARVTAIRDGTATISATSGGTTGTIAVTVRRRVVNMVVTAQDTVIFPGAASQLGLIGFDARGNPIPILSGITYASSDPDVLPVSPDGVVTVASDTGPSNSAVVAVTYTHDGEQLTRLQRLFISPVAPPRYDFFAVLVPERVRPEPVTSPADGIVYLTVTDSGLDFRLIYREVSGRALGAHIHGPSDADGVAGILADFPIADQPDDRAAVEGTLTPDFIRARDGGPPISVDSLVALIRSGATYVEVQGSQYPAGEIRGMLVPRR